MTTPTVNPLTDDEVAAFREMASKATPGKWELVQSLTCGHLRHANDGDRVAKWPQDDINFIAACSVIADRLAAEWQEMRGQLAAAKARISEYRRAVNEGGFNGSGVDILVERIETLQSELAAANARIMELELYGERLRKRIEAFEYSARQRNIHRDD